MPTTSPAAATGLPFERLNDVHDCLTLALDAMERPGGRYTQSEREARSYVRTALRRLDKSGAHNEH